MIIWKLEISHTFCLKVFAANLNLDFDAASVGANRHFPGRIAHTHRLPSPRPSNCRDHAACEDQAEARPEGAHRQDSKANWIWIWIAGPT